MEKGLGTLEAKIDDVEAAMMSRGPARCAGGEELDGVVVACSTVAYLAHGDVFGYLREDYNISWVLFSAI